MRCMADYADSRSTLWHALQVCARACVAVRACVRCACDRVRACCSRARWRVYVYVFVRACHGECGAVPGVLCLPCLRVACRGLR